jgi:hypothetical protein
MILFSTVIEAEIKSPPFGFMKPRFAPFVSSIYLIGPGKFIHFKAIIN